jgi:hypothetical protein
MKNFGGEEMNLSQHIWIAVALWLSAVPATAQPKPKVIFKDDLADCNAAVDWIKNAPKIGEAHAVGYRAAFNYKKQEVKSEGSTKWIASGTTKWVYNLKASSTTLWIPKWPKMSPNEKAAVTRYRQALVAHENKHHTDAKQFFSKAGREISVEGSDEADVESKIDAELAKHGEETDDTFRKEDEEYDHRTDHGRNQRADGGVNVELICPKATVKPVLPEGWGEVFSGSGSPDSGDANIQAGLAALSTDVGRMAATMGDIAQGACAGRKALRSAEQMSDRYVAAHHLERAADQVVWPLQSPQDRDVLMRATGSFRETMGSVKIPPGSDEEERGLFLAAALGSLWHEIARAKRDLDDSAPEAARGLKAWIADQIRNPSSIYSCF